MGSLSPHSSHRAAGSQTSPRLFMPRQLAEHTFACRRRWSIGTEQTSQIRGPLIPPPLRGQRVCVREVRPLSRGRRVRCFGKSSGDGQDGEYPEWRSGHGDESHTAARFGALGAWRGRAPACVRVEALGTYGPVAAGARRRTGELWPQPLLSGEGGCYAARTSTVCSGRTSINAGRIMTGDPPTAGLHFPEKTTTRGRTPGRRSVYEGVQLHPRRRHQV